MSTVYRQSFFVVLLKLLSGASTFVLYVIFSHHISPSSLGIYELSMTLVMLFSQLMSIGLVQFTCVELVRKDFDNVTDTIHKINSIYLIISFCCSLILFLLLFLLKEKLMYSFWDMSLVILISFLFFFRNMYSGILQHTFKPIKYSIVEALYPFLSFYSFYSQYD